MRCKGYISLQYAHEFLIEKSLKQCLWLLQEIFEHFGFTQIFIFVDFPEVIPFPQINDFHTFVKFATC